MRNRRLSQVGGFALGIVIAAADASAAACAKRAEVQPSIARIGAVMAAGRFIAYQPSALKMIDGRATPADQASIRADLQTLRPRFDGLITYSSINGAEHVPAVAAALGFRAVIMGV
jgi:hypothetical protein